MDLTPTTHVHAPARNRAALVAVAVSFCMAVAKLAVGALSGSVAVIASGLDSLLDVIASGVNAWAIHAAEAPPDAEHGFGHGKFESIAALTQAAFVGGSAVLVCLEAAQRFASQSPIHHANLALLTVGASTVATIVLVTWQKREVARTGSVAVAADRAHYTTDVIAGVGVMGAVYASSAFKLWWVDPVVSIGVAGMLLWTGFQLARRALSHLLDAALPPADLQVIEGVIARHSPPIVGHHGLRTRSDGLSRFVDVHLEIDGSLTLHQANRVYADVVTGLREALPGVDLSIHLDPAGDPDPIDRK
jgi:ferrous-iron efflux pump FieF